MRRSIVAFGHLPQTANLRTYVATAMQILLLLLKFQCEAEHTMMNLRIDEDDDRSTASLAWCVLQLLSIRNTYLERNGLSEGIHLSDVQAKAMWNSDLQTYFMEEMHHNFEDASLSNNDVARGSMTASARDKQG